MSKKITRDDFWENYWKLENRVEALEDMLRMPSVYPSGLYTSLYESTTALWAKFSRLFHYLGVSDVTIPEEKLVRKTTVSVKRPVAKQVRAKTAPKSELRNPAPGRTGE